MAFSALTASSREPGSQAKCRGYWLHLLSATEAELLRNAVITIGTRGALLQKSDHLRWNRHRARPYSAAAPSNCGSARSWLRAPRRVRNGRRAPAAPATSAEWR